MGIYKLGDICQIVSGSTPKTGISEYWDGDIKWITPAEINDDTYIITDSVRKITKLAVEKTGLLELPKGTVILSSRAPIGKVAIAGCTMYCNQGFKNFVCTEKINNKYLYWFLKSKTSYLNSLGRGATFKELSKAIVSNIEIDVPDMRKQEDIVDNLERINTIIKLRRRQINALEEITKARFVEMFGDPIKMIAAGETELLENLTDEVSVGFVGESTNEYVDAGIPYLRMQNIRSMKVVSDNLIYINEEFHKKIKKASVFTDDVVISRVGINRGMTAVIPPEYNNSSIGNAIIIRKNKKFNSLFLAAYITYAYGKHTSIGYSKGSAQGAIGVGLVKRWPIVKADISLQNQFADFAKQVNKSKLEVQKALDKTQILFDSLMQQYFG